jgi:nitrogen fixation NifU-like protein
MKDNGIDIRRQIILDHYESPSKKIESVTEVDASYCVGSKSSASCIDNISAYVKVINDKIADIKFHGVGCAIATSSTDIMSNLLVGKTVSKAKTIIDKYLSMIDGKKCDAKLLGDLYVYENVNKQLNRVNCAKIGILAIKAALENLS